MAGNFLLFLYEEKENNRPRCVFERMELWKMQRMNVAVSVPSPTTAAANSAQARLEIRPRKRFALYTIIIFRPVIRCRVYFLKTAIHPTTTTTTFPSFFSTYANNYSTPRPVNGREGLQLRKFAANYNLCVIIRELCRFYPVVDIQQ